MLYNLRHLQERKLTSLLTIGGIALVVFVFVTTLMFSEGLNQTLAGTGLSSNAIVIRNGAENEIQSSVSREVANIILAEEEVARNATNEAIATTDIVVMATMKRKNQGGTSNVTIRGTSKFGLEVRPSVVLSRGRLPRPGTQEVMVGAKIQDKFEGLELGQSIRLVGTDWPVVGVFEAGNSAFSSEIWGDADILLPAFRRDAYSILTFKLKSGANLEQMKTRLSADPRLNITIQREDLFYAEQSKMLSNFIKYVGVVVSMFFSIGAVLGAMITMFSSVANRTKEIGMLRAIGFLRRQIAAAFLVECLAISFAGGVLGIFLASFMQFLPISTTNFQTFAEVVFGFNLTPRICVEGIGFSLLMGFLGGTLPARRAACMNIIDTLRDS